MGPRAGRIVFAGSPDFAVPSLQAVAASRHEVVGVLTQPDRPAGRGREIRPGPVKAEATRHQYRVLQPESMRSADAIEALAALHPDLLVVVAYGQILSAAVLELPTRGCINVHASLLPRWRGAAPIQAAVLAGDAKTGVSLMQLEQTLDTGPVYATEETPIGPGDTAGDLHDRLAELGASLLAEQLDDIVAGRLQPVPQPAAGATYAGRIDKADAVIDWQQDARRIARMVRAYHPRPVAETTITGKRLRIWRAEPITASSTSAIPGEIVSADADDLIVQTGMGCLRVLELQLAGRKRLPAGDFARGRSLAGQVLGV